MRGRNRLWQEKTIPSRLRPGPLCRQEFPINRDVPIYHTWINIDLLWMCLFNWLEEESQLFPQPCPSLSHCLWQSDGWEEAFFSKSLWCPAIPNWRISKTLGGPCLWGLGCHSHRATLSHVNTALSVGMGENEKKLHGTPVEGGLYLVFSFIDPSVRRGKLEFCPLNVGALFFSYGHERVNLRPFGLYYTITPVTHLWLPFSL